MYFVLKHNCEQWYKALLQCVYNAVLFIRSQDAQVSFTHLKSEMLSLVQSILGN